MSGYAELEFDLPGALLWAMLRKFDEIEQAQLATENTVAIPNEQGVYLLFHHPPTATTPQLVYVGKTDSEAGLKSRLTRHSKKLVGRHNLEPDHVFFKALRLYVFTAMDLETELIHHFGGVSKVPWNNSGFGSNDPGRERDTTKYKTEHFDAQFPINIDNVFVEFKDGAYKVVDVIKKLKSSAPYLIRFERPSQARSAFPVEFENSTVELRAQMTTRQVLAACINSLPSGWHATRLPSHIIIYKDDKRVFPSGELIART